MEKLDYWSLVNFLLLKQNTLTYSCLTDTKLHVDVVNCQEVNSGKLTVQSIDSRGALI